MGLLWPSWSTWASSMVRMPPLGQSSCALVDVTLSKSNLFVMTRNAVLLTNMCIGKSIDGIARLVTKTDFYGLKAKKYEDTLKNCETFLEYAWNKATQSQIDRSKSYKILHWLP